MKSLKFLAFILVGLALTTASCKKTDDDGSGDGDPAKKTCYVNKMDYGDNYSVLSYNSEHQVIKVENFDSLGTPDGSNSQFTYVNGKMETMENWDSGVLDSKIIYHYATTGKPDSAYMWGDEGNGFEKLGTYVLTFTGDDLTKTEMVVEYLGQSITVEKTEYTYTNGNIATMSKYEFDITSLSLNLISTSTFEYDNKKSPYRGIGLDYFFIADDAGFMSTNNPTKETIKDKSGSVSQDESMNYSYEYNSDDYPTKVTETAFDNNYTETTLLSYDCQ